MHARCTTDAIQLREINRWEELCAELWTCDRNPPCFISIILSLILAVYGVDGGKLFAKRNWDEVKQGRREGKDKEFILAIKVDDSFFEYIF